MKNIGLLLMLLLFAFMAHAQPIEVYVAKGDVQLKQKGKSVKPTQGAQLDANCTVVLPEKAQLVLYSGEKAVVLNEAGTYTYKQIAAQFEQSKKSITDRYIAYIWNQAHETGDSPKGGTSSVTGMVSRGGNNQLGFQDSSVVISEYFVLVLAPDLALAAERDSVRLFVYDRKKPLFNEVFDSTYMMLRKDSRFAQGKWYGLAATAQNQPPLNGIRYFKWATESEAESFYAALVELNESLRDFPDEVRSEITAAFFIENRYLYYQNGD